MHVCICVYMSYICVCVCKDERKEGRMVRKDTKNGRTDGRKDGRKDAKEGY